MCVLLRLLKFSGKLPASGQLANSSYRQRRFQSMAARRRSTALRIPRASLNSRNKSITWSEPRLPWGQIDLGLSPTRERVTDILEPCREVPRGFALV